MSSTDDGPQVEEQHHAPEAVTAVVDALPEQTEVGIVISKEEEDVKKSKKEKGVKERKKRKLTTNKPPSHPPYFHMIKEAITALNEKTGSSPYAIAKYMEENHKPVLPANFRKILGLQLKNSVSKGKLIKVKASFKLAEVVKKEDNKPTRSTKTRAARANAVTKPKEATTTTTTTTKKRKVKSREVSKIGDSSPIPSFPNAASATRGRRSKRSTPSGKWRQLKSIRGPIGKKAKKVATA